ncbi:MAG: dihydrolipoyl dehydrogenase [Myxococcales bacterium]|nr:dihydrolipoyl dehydrogenase [Myxococcales bacterium]
MSTVYDVVVLGAGPGGYVCAIRCAQAGLKTLCVESAKLGGVCLNVGCIPSKALIHASKTYRKAKDGAAMGIVAGDLRVDVAALQAWKEGITAKLSSGIGGLFKGNKVEHVAGRARLAGPGKVHIDKTDGSVLTVETKNVVLATGSAPASVAGFAVDNIDILDSTGALALGSVPKAMVVIGGGVIGLELTDVYARLGCDVTVVEFMDRLLVGLDADLVRPVELKQKKLGVKHLVASKALGWQRTLDGRLEVVIETAGKDGPKKTALPCDKVLVAVGRRPNTANLGLESVGLQPDTRGFLAVDKQQRTGAAGVFAIGDIVPGPMLAHKASAEGEVAAEVLAGHAAAMDKVAMPNVVYTDPEIATVGPSLAELEKAGRKVKVGKFGFGSLGRAMTANATDGFARVVVDADSGLVLAVHVVGAEASELIAAAGYAVEMAATAEDLALIVHAHPTMAEALLEASLAALGHPLHQLKPPPPREPAKG